MAGKTIDFQKIKKVMGKNFIGPEELKKISRYFSVSDPFKIGKKIPQIPFDLNYLKKINKEYILILGIPKDKDNQKLTINNMRLMFGSNSQKSEPSFYNQDWYLREKFAKDIVLEFRWYLIKKSIDKNSCGKNPEDILKNLKNKEKFPPAILTVFTFFSYYFFTNGEILWKHNFVWCSDKDKNGDRIYTGRYIDPQKINKNGFNIHRHLSIRSCYGLAPQIS